MLSLIRMPQMGVSDESAILSKWLVREEDRICKGQSVFSLETDKATFQYEAESDGFLVRILTGEGEEATVGSPVGIISDTEEFKESELEALLNELNRTAEKQQSPANEESDCSQKDKTDPVSEHVFTPNTQNAGLKVSPRARKTANGLGVNLNSVHTGSGPEGRILERDVLSAVQNEAGLESRGIYSGRPLTTADRVRMRQTCTEGTGQTGFVSRMFDARKLLMICTPQNRLTPGAAVCCELARLLVKTPELNARRHGDKNYEYNTVHLRLNVETRSGTLKPVIRCAETYTATELAVLMRNAAERCRCFSSKPQEFQEGTFSVADLSGYGVDSFTPELTPPELCALGIGAVTIHTRIDEQGSIEAYPAIRLTLVYDRAGADALSAARFLNGLALRLEQGGTTQYNK